MLTIDKYQMSITSSFRSNILIKLLTECEPTISLFMPTVFLLKSSR